MINEDENMLIVLGEECGEVIKEVSKCLRFTPYDVGPNGQLPNEYKLQVEMYEAIAVFEELQRTIFSTIPEEKIEQIKKDKIERVKHWFDTFDKDAVEI